MAAGPERLSQESSAYGQIGFEERQSLLINAGWGARQNNKLLRCIRDARFVESSAVVENIDYHEDKHLWTRHRSYDLLPAMLPVASSNQCGISSEELTPMVRENYTAMLLVCDPVSGTPQEFYSVKGSLGSELAISDTGELLWSVESITSTFFSPATSSFTIGGTSCVYQYTFDNSGQLIRQEKTVETVEYRR